jgi:hypothetical protein
MRNNLEERLAKQRHTEDDGIFAQQVTQENSISFINPTELVDLPSKGKFYPEGHPLKDADHIEIRQMTAKEEDILTNKSLIKKGIVIDRLIESLLVDRSIPVQSILVGDKNAIMIAARMSAYGPKYSVFVSCQECGAKNNLQIDLLQSKSRTTEDVLEEVKNDESVDINEYEHGNIAVTLPKTKWKVRCKLMNGRDETKILQTIEEKRRGGNTPELSISDQLKLIVFSINDVEDRDTLNLAVESMPAYDAKYLRNIYQKFVPNVFIKEKFSCSSCLEEQEVEVPFTQEFFWPK